MTNSKKWLPGRWRMSRYEVKVEVQGKKNATYHYMAKSMRGALEAYAKGQGYPSWLQFCGNNPMMAGFDGLRTITLSAMTAFAK